MIEVENLSKRFGKTQAVAGLSFRVEPGTITGFLGPNGAGKSTTLRSVLGLVHPDAGSAVVLGVPYRRLDRPLHQVGAVLEASEVHRVAPAGITCACLPRRRACRYRAWTRC